jgi:hypothetical protein
MTFEDSIALIDQTMERLRSEVGRLRASHADLLAAAKRVIAAFGGEYDGTLRIDENNSLRALQSAIAAVEESAP